MDKILASAKKMKKSHIRKMTEALFFTDSPEVLYISHDGYPEYVLEEYEKNPDAFISQLRESDYDWQSPGNVSHYYYFEYGGSIKEITIEEAKRRYNAITSGTGYEASAKKMKKSDETYVVTVSPHEYDQNIISGYMERRINEWYLYSSMDYDIDGEYVGCSFQGDDLIIGFEENGVPMECTIHYYKDYTPEQIFNIWMESDWVEKSKKSASTKKSFNDIVVKMRKKNNNME